MGRSCHSECWNEVGAGASAGCPGVALREGGRQLTLSSASVSFLPHPCPSVFSLWGGGRRPNTDALVGMSGWPLGSLGWLLQPSLDLSSVGNSKISLEMEPGGQWSSAGSCFCLPLPPVPRTLEILETLGCHPLVVGGGGATGIWWVAARDSANAPHRTAPHKEDFSSSG